MSVVPNNPCRYSVTEYLDLEYKAGERHEYRGGDIVAMAGGTPEHSLIIANVVRELGVRLKGGPFRVYDSNLRVQCPRWPLYTYPDLTVICGPTQHDPQDPRKQTITNPKLILEVLSPFTEGYDRGDKLAEYVMAASLEDYVLVSGDKPRVETFHRRGDGTWSLAFFDGIDATAQFLGLSVEVSLRDIYLGVNFATRRDLPPR
jgi:Uma2 family endonuclease